MEKNKYLLKLCEVVRECIKLESRYLPVNEINSEKNNYIYLILITL